MEKQFITKRFVIQVLGQMISTKIALPEVMPNVAIGCTSTKTEHIKHKIHRIFFSPFFVFFVLFRVFRVEKIKHEIHEISRNTRKVREHNFSSVISCSKKTFILFEHGKIFIMGISRFCRH
jgi:hypothetical protein